MRSDRSRRTKQSHPSDQSDDPAAKLARREFLASAAALGTAIAGVSVRKSEAATTSAPTGINTPRVEGEYYKAEVPDTLDLAERAHTGLAHFLNLISVENDYEMYWGAEHYYPSGMNALMGFNLPQKWGGTFLDYNPPAMTFNPTVLMACQGKAVEAMAMLRIMSGSRDRLDLEESMLRMMASNIGGDGVYYVPQTGGRKPWLGPEEWRPYANTHGQARLMRGMIAWYQYTGDPFWKDHIDRMVNGLDTKMAVHKGDYAYVPTGGWLSAEYFRSCYLRDRGWKTTDEPPNEKAGEEGSMFNHQGHTPGALSNWYMLTGNQQALKLAGELVNFYTKPQFWADFPGGEYPGTEGADHAHFQGHWHGYVNTLRAILEYAIATNDPRLKMFVRDGYNWARQSGLSRIGFFADSQGCACGRLLGLSVKMTYAGVGDYWEDIDQYIRNHGTEMQFMPEDIPHLKAVGEGKPAPPVHPSVTSDNVIERTMGGYSSSHSPLKVNSGMCCCTHGNMGTFYAWDGALRYNEGRAQVNLLLNRASPWLDVDSHLPYQGKVVLRNKAAKEIWVRIPLWVDAAKVQCQVAGRPARPEWFGRYLRFEHVDAGKSLVIEFPIEDRTETWTGPPNNPKVRQVVDPGTVFTMRFCGNTLAELTPPLAPGSWLYQQRPGQFSTKEAPKKEVTRYVTPFRLKW